MVSQTTPAQLSNSPANPSNIPRRFPGASIVVFALQLCKEDLKYLTEEEREDYEGLSYPEVKQIQTFIVKQDLQSSGIWRQARTGLAPSRKNYLCSILVLAVRGQPLPSADVIEQIKKDYNISQDPAWYRAFSVSKH